MSLRTDAELGTTLGKSRQSISSYRRRGVIPYTLIVKLWDLRPLEITYILFGEPGSPNAVNYDLMRMAIDFTIARYNVAKSNVTRAYGMDAARKHFPESAYRLKGGFQARPDT